MIFDQNYEVVLSFTIYLLVKIYCNLFMSPSFMQTSPTLTSIPERVVEDSNLKWVSRKRHDVLKAKYKCLKKLFQVYDASVIGILPDTYAQQTEKSSQEDEQTMQREKPIYAKSDASAETDVYCIQTPAANAVIKDLGLDENSINDSSKTTVPKDDKSTQGSKENLSMISRNPSEVGTRQRPETGQRPCLVINGKRKPTRFQSFVQRILGIGREKNCAYLIPHDREYSASDNNLSNTCKRRRRGLRLRRCRRAKKTTSESGLRDFKTPVVMSYVRSIQRNCLMDTTPRLCPIVGCKMLLNGIINYNDHLNLCHFPERAFVCLYCHEGFARERDKFLHEDNHIGITRLAAAAATSPTPRFSTKIASNTQTDPEVSKINVPDEKLKKIVSFFDKISDPEQTIAGLKINRCSEANLQTLHVNPRTEVDSSSGSENSDLNKMTLTLKKARNGVPSSAYTEEALEYSRIPSERCQFCGDCFDFRSQLNQHVHENHRVNKFTKYKSCVGFGSRAVEGEDYARAHSTTQSLTGSVASTDVSTASNLSKAKSNDTLTYDPSTNIVYYTSMESVKRPSSVRSGFSYKWVPGTKIIRV